MSDENKTFDQQAKDALAKANVVRLANARTGREIAAQPRETGERMVAAILENPTGTLPSYNLRLLLGAPKRRGDHFAARVLRALDLEHHDKVGDLTERQRKLLAAVVRAGYSTEGISFDEFGFARERVAA